MGSRLRMGSQEPGKICRLDFSPIGGCAQLRGMLKPNLRSSPNFARQTQLGGAGEVCQSTNERVNADRSRRREAAHSIRYFPVRLVSFRRFQFPHSVSIRDFLYAMSAVGPLTKITLRRRDTVANIFRLGYKECYRSSIHLELPCVSPSILRLVKWARPPQRPARRRCARRLRGAVKRI